MPPSARRGTHAGTQRAAVALRFTSEKFGFLPHIFTGEGVYCVLQIFCFVVHSREPLPRRISRACGGLGNNSVTIFQ